MFILVVIRINMYKTAILKKGYNSGPGRPGPDLTPPPGSGGPGQPGGVLHAHGDRRQVPVKGQCLDVQIMFYYK